MGRYNLRGPTTRGPCDGGDQERDLGVQFREWARVVGDRWHRTARLLHQFAEEYEREARLLDAEAERRASED